MSKLIRMLVGVVLFGTLLAFAPVKPAVADHDCLPGAVSDSPCPAAGAGVAGDGINGWHEEMPNRMTAAPEHTCFVTGTVVGGNAPTPPASGGHTVPPPGVDEPAHSHFQFLNTVIACDDNAGLSVTAEGGNDGHFITIDPTAQVEADLAAPDCAYNHSPNKHHGATTESGWSHSADYSGGSARCPASAEHNGGASGTCKAGAANNKADITINGFGGSPNFVKYVRMGNVVYYWGCSEAFARAPFTAPFARRFSGVLVIAPDPRTAAFPLCVPPGGAGCDLLLTGPGVRGNAWL